MNFPLEYVIVEDHEQDGLRSGEGGIARLKDGRLLMLYSCFHGGGADHSAASIAARTSTDQGRSWSEPATVFTAPESALNVMSAAVIRLRDGRLAAQYCIKYTQEHLIPVVTFSTDEGQSWSTPCPVTDTVGYFVVNNDRLTELRDGTLVIPYAHHVGTRQTLDRERWNAHCGLFYSRDGGAQWHRGAHEIRHAPDLFTEPMFPGWDPNDTEVATLMRERRNVFQEPGVVQRQDGSLMVYVRSLWAIYRAFAPSVEAPWQDVGVIEGFNVPCGPATIRRLPGTNRLVMLYNDRGTQPFGTKGFQNRTPLSVAVSDDEGLHWKRLPPLEDDAYNYCYFSLLFHDERFIASYYQSAVRPGDGPEYLRRRNLASLKVLRGPSAVFTEG